jgi:hypothetical protein
LKKSQLPYTRQDKYYAWFGIFITKWIGGLGALIICFTTIFPPVSGWLLNTSRRAALLNSIFNINIPSEVLYFYFAFLTFFTSLSLFSLIVVALPKRSQAYWDYGVSHRARNNAKTSRYAILTVSVVWAVTFLLLSAT